MEFEEIKFIDGQILSLKPDDIVVLRLKGHLRDEQYERLRLSIKPIVSNKVMILEDDMQISVLRIEELLKEETK